MITECTDMLFESHRVKIYYTGDKKGHSEAKHSKTKIQQNKENRRLVSIPSVKKSRGLLEAKVCC